MNLLLFDLNLCSNKVLGVNCFLFSEDEFSTMFHKIDFCSLNKNSFFTVSVQYFINYEHFRIHFDRFTMKNNFFSCFLTIFR